MKHAIKWAPLFILIVIVWHNPSASAQYFKASSWTLEKTYTEKTVHKLGFGILNFFTGWTALFFEPTWDSNPLIGLSKGILHTVTNTAGGAIHAVTFPIPLDLPLPEGGVRFVKSETSKE